MKTLDELKKDGWTFVANFGNCLVMAKGDERMLWKPSTGEIVFLYNVKGGVK